jgi:hypothetical protein
VKTYGEEFDTGDEIQAALITVAKNDAANSRYDFSGYVDNLTGPQWYRGLQLQANRRQVTQLARASLAVCIRVNDQWRVIRHPFKGTFCGIGEAQRGSDLQWPVTAVAEKLFCIA